MSVIGLLLMTIVTVVWLPAHADGRIFPHVERRAHASSGTLDYAADQKNVAYGGIAWASRSLGEEAVGRKWADPELSGKPVETTGALISVNGPEPTMLIAYGVRDPRSIDAGSLSVFNQALALIKKYYGREVFGIHEFKRALDRVSIVMLPHCLDEVPQAGEEAVDPEKWFIRALRSICARCGADAGRTLLTSLNYLLHDLDPRSGLLGPAMVRELKITTSGRFGGVGVVVSPKDGKYIVISAFEGSPAHKAGIQSGDTVLEIEGEPIGGLPVPEVLVKVRGRAGTHISLTIRSRRTGEISEFRLRRRTIRVPPVQYSDLGDGIGYVRIVNFQQTTSSEARRALKRLYGKSRNHLKGLILDLRNNPGGLFDQAIDVANLFLSDQVITRLRGTDGGTNQEFRASKRGTFPEVPMVVLVNRGSASASEILAAALNQRSNVFLMGEPTFGKASVQGIFLLDRGMALRLTTAHYYTPEGQDIDKIGIEPDIRITSDTETQDPIMSALSGINRLRAEEGIRAAMRFLRGPRTPFSSPY